MNEHENIKDLTYPHHVIQLADLYLTKAHAEDSPKALIAMYLYSLLKNEITIKINFDELTKNIGPHLLPIVDAIKDLANNRLSNTEKIQEKIEILSSKNTENEIIRKDIENLVIFSIFIELIVNEKLGKTIEIIDKKIKEILSSSYNFSDLVKLIKAKVEKKYQYDDSNNTVIQGLLLIYNLNSDLDEEKRKDLRLRLFRWVKNVSEVARYIQPESEDILPTSEVIYETYLSAIILTILDYRSSCSLRKYDFQAFLDKLLGYNLYEEEKKKLIEEILTIKISEHITLPLHYAIILYTSLFVVIIILIFLSIDVTIQIINLVIGCFLSKLFIELLRTRKYFIKRLRDNK